MRKVDLSKAVEPKDITKPEPVVTPMPEPVQIPEELQRLGQPSSMWVYRMADGGAFGAVARWDPPGHRKIVRPIIWNGKKYVTSGFGDTRPLYNSELLAASPLATALVVEGEKAAVGAQRFLPEGWIITTWQGGSKAWQKTDWSLMAGRSVVIWPDNDGAGIEAAEDIRVSLSRAGVRTSVVAVPPSMPDGWDLGDDLPPKVTPDIISQLLKRALRDATIVDEENVPEIEQLPEPEEDLDLWPERLYRPVGYGKRIFYLMTAEGELVEEWRGSTLMSEQGLMEIVGDEQIWFYHQQNAGKKKGINWTGIGASIISECRQAGVYDPTLIRGRGVWLDPDRKGNDRVVLNSGDQLMFSRGGDAPTRVPYVQFKSPWIYEKERDLIREVSGNVNFTDPLTDTEGYAIRELCDMVRWENPVYGQLLAGWIATAIICGALPWRTHAWVTGNQGSGKTTVINEIAGACIGSVGIYPMGATTEAGIRQAVGNDALPVIFDESEGQKGMEERRQAVIQLMRQASSEGRGRIMKGTAGHSAVAFTMRSSFLMSSIGVGLKEAADLTRTVVLTIKPLEAFSFGERKQLEEQWQRFLSLAHGMRKDTPQRLLSRQMRNIFTLKSNIEVFKEVIASTLGNRRLGDQLGTLLAGSYSLISTRKVTRPLAEKYLDNYDWSEFTQVKAVREDMALLQHVCGKLIKAETRNGTQDRAIGELIYGMIYPHTDDTLNPVLAEQTLSRYGLRMEPDKSGIWVATGVPALHQIMRSSDYAEGWDKVLGRLPNSKRSNGPMRFRGQNSRAIFVPMTEWPLGNENV